jgi:hypothetical protein
MNALFYIIESTSGRRYLFCSSRHSLRWCNPKGSRDVVVGIATTLLAEVSGGLNPGRDKIFLFKKCPDGIWGAKTSYSMGTGNLPFG